MLSLKNENYEVVMRDDPAYSLECVDNTNAYDRKYLFAEEVSYLSSKHGIFVSSRKGKSYSCILLAGGGASGVHAYDRAFDYSCIVAVGCYMCSLSIPGLELGWHTQTDWATCFGVYHSPKYSCYISHGELEIARVSYSGEVEWRASGKDIFTNSFTLHEDYIEAVDFNDESYRIEIETGLCKIH